MPPPPSSAFWTNTLCSPAPRRKRTTTPPSSDAIELPDCTKFPEDVTSDDLFDLLDSKEVIRALAEGGFEAARAILDARAASDPALAQRIAEMRERVRRQAERNVARTMSEYDRRIVELETVGRRSAAEIAAELAAMEARRQRARSLDLSNFDAGLFEEVRSALLLPDQPWMHPPSSPGFLDRLRALFRRLVAWLRGLFGRRKRSTEPVRKDRTIVFAALSGSGRTIGRSEIGDAIAQLNSREREELASSVDRSYKARERDLARSAEEKRKEAEAQRRALEAERKEAERRAEHDADRRVRDTEEKRLARELKERGFVAERQGEIQVTYGLIERFARLVLEEETRQLPADVRLSLSGSASTGVYEKARLRRSEEIAHLDLPGSLLAARLEGSRHIDESTSYVYREITSERVHVVLVFDKSGSMSESEKLPAAKKALLALYVAIRKRNPQATIDVVAFDNEVRVLDLLELWECTPGSFTNTAEALHTAHLLLASSRASRREVYLVTDGLPESYTDRDGRVRSGQLDVAMARALERARELATVTPLKFTMILLRSEHPEYEAAAREITRTVGGSLAVTDPERLGVELLIRWAGGTETVKRPVEAEAVPARRPSTAASKGKRRKSDRRMGG
ncbi:MAG: VWA domain-containing protein [Thermoplasmata archaeon]|nr:VWA domain-containing protein [Thermoplasmata archaeon]MCI4359750.1 VWA domain-containing protein [Thermoplasmata archaeon]